MFGLLLGVTVVTGLVDAFSYLAFGHAFVANMTGNVVFLGFALAGAPGFSIAASLAALAAFLAGAGIGARLFRAGTRSPIRLLALATLLETTVLAAGLALAMS